MDARFQKIIQNLVKDKLGLNPEDFELFGLQHEGKPLPGGYEEISGCILTKNEKVYDFWVKWDSQKTAPDGSLGYYSLGDTTYTRGGIPYFEEISSETYDKIRSSPDYLRAKEKLLRRRRKLRE